MGMAQVHISPNTKEMSSVKKSTIECVGRKQPSKEALDKFIEIYKQMVKYCEEKEREQ